MGKSSTWLRRPTIDNAVKLYTAFYVAIREGHSVNAIPFTGYYVERCSQDSTKYKGEDIGTYLLNRLRGSARLGFKYKVNRDNYILTFRKHLGFLLPMMGLQEFTDAPIGVLCDWLEDNGREEEAKALRILV